MSHININELDFSQLKIAKSGRMLKLVYNKEPLQLVTGMMYTPFGVKGNTNNYSNFTNYHLDCSLNQSNSEASVKYRESLEALDRKIVELIQESQDLFNTGNDNIDFSDVQNVYSPVLRENKTFPKLMKITLPRDSKGNFDFVIFDEGKSKVFVDDNSIEQVLTKGKIFKGIIECGKVWYYKGRFGTMWNLKQMKFVENKSDIHQNKTQTQKSEIYETNMLLDD